MELSIDVLARLDVNVVRAALPAWVSHHVQTSPEGAVHLMADVGAVLAAASDEELRGLQAYFATAGDEYRLYAAHPLARDITRRFMHHLNVESTIEGRDHLDRFLSEGPRRRMIVCNHLSYTDTQVTDCVLADQGMAEVANRLVAIAGPKVYTEAWRRMAAIALNTRKTAQSSTVATEQDALGPRELAAIAFETIRDCERLMDEGYIVLLYPEGRRARNGRLQPFLKAAHRYLAIPELQVLPFAQTGTEVMYPVDSSIMHITPARLQFGAAFRPVDHPGRTGAIEEVWRRVAGLLPPHYTPEVGQAMVL